VTSIVVTHDILSTRVVADRIAWLSEGRMEFIGTLAEAMASGSETLQRFLVSGGGIGENRQD
jgi:ABC-type transporter Mla maintaining outer membrane lipid asymmetry ATPase subunit MlaF